MPVTTHSADSYEDLLWGFRYWWPHRHGINAGAIRDILRNYLKHLRERREEG